MELNEQLLFLHQLMNCGDSIGMSRYDGDGNLLAESEISPLLHRLFAESGCLENGLRNGNSGASPSLLGTSFGLVWGADYRKGDNGGTVMYVIGPVFHSDISRSAVDRAVRGMTIASAVRDRQALLDELMELPVVQINYFSRCLLMLHFVLTGEKLDPGSLNRVGWEPVPVSAEKERDRHRLYFAEQAMLRLVENGDLNYSKVLSRSMSMSSGVSVRSKDPLRSSRNSVIIFATLLTRAAIRGGLSPEAAYSLGDSYIQRAEDAEDLERLSALSHQMYDDFIHRVHDMRKNPDYSAAVQKCVDYIEMHLDEPVRASALSRLTGYAEYYLTDKFRQETGVSVSDYAKFAKIERAKLLLETTEDGIQEIADQLGFSSRNYFSRVFSELTGCSPKEYRKRFEKGR